MKLSHIRLAGVRTLAGDHRIDLSEGLNVIAGQNNSGKSTILRAPFVLVCRGQYTSFVRADRPDGSIGLCFECSAEEASTFDLSARRINDISLRAPRLATLGQAVPGFTNWEASPKFELSLNWQGGSAWNELRLYATDGSDTYIRVFNGEGNGALICADGPNDWVNVDLSWYRETLTAMLSRSVHHSLFAYWDHDPRTGGSGWISQHGRRLVDTSEERLLEVLTFLRMKHPLHFEHVRAAVARSLPELGGLDFIDVEARGFSYRPGFPAASGDQILAREFVGVGAWTFLCIVTAAHAAYVTGARFLFLDEPHLHLHPALERCLLRELLDRNCWKDGALQIIASTHSATMIDSAANAGSLHLVSWADERRTFATVARQSNTALTRALPSEILFSSAILFVEGPSDASAIERLLRRKFAGTSVRIVPLLTVDSSGPIFREHIDLLLRAMAPVATAMCAMILDGDKKKKLESEWSKRATDPRSKMSRIYFVNSATYGLNDIESLFCDADFLVEYILSHAPTADRAEVLRVVEAHLHRLVANPTRHSEKACEAVRSIHRELVDDVGSDTTKATLLDSMMEFYLSHEEAVFCSRTRRELRPIIEVLETLAAAP